VDLDGLTMAKTANKSQKVYTQLSERQGLESRHRVTVKTPFAKRSIVCTRQEKAYSILPFLFTESCRSLSKMGVMFRRASDKRQWNVLPG